MYLLRISAFARASFKVLLLLSVLAGWNMAVAQDQPYERLDGSVQVNINEADAETIADVLVGVGMSRAQAIVEYRVEHGPFNEVKELVQVKGIGQSTVDSNVERITLK